VGALDTDVAIVGAGSAGAAVAWLCARRGLRVTVCEAGALEEAGARWAVSVPGWTFDEAGIPRPSGDELLGEDGPVVVVAGDHRVRFDHHGVLDLDGRLLCARLRAAAAAAGATLLEHARVERWDEASGHLHTAAGVLAPRFIVDASGLGGARLLGQAPPRPRDICSAAQHVHAVRDLEGARRFFAAHGAQLGDAVSYLGVAGGYSTIGLRCKGERVGVLAGSVVADGHPSAPRLLERFLEGQPWIGERLFGGARDVPLGRTADRLAIGRVAAIGDAAGQVFSTLGSGIGHELLGARALADALASGRGPEAYGVTFQRRHGGELAAFDLFRRLTQRLTIDEQARLIAAGLFSPALARCGLSQGERLPGPLPLARAALGAVRAPLLGARLARVVAGMGLLYALYRAYPADPARVAAWSRRIERVVVAALP
jgi:flavin-dependent dehydrogenase